MTYRKLLIISTLAALLLMVTCVAPIDMHFKATAQNKPAPSSQIANHQSSTHSGASTTLKDDRNFTALLRNSQIADEGIKRLLREYSTSTTKPADQANAENVLIGVKNQGQDKKDVFDITPKTTSLTSNFFKRPLNPIEIAFPGLLDEATYANVLTSIGNTNAGNRSFYALPNATGPAFARITSSPNVSSGAISTIAVTAVATPLPSAALFMASALLGGIIRRTRSRNR